MLQQRLVWLGISVSLGLTGCSLFGLPQVPSTSRPSLSVYASMPAKNAVSVMNLGDKRYVGTIAVGQGPANIAVNPRSDLEYLYSANENDGTVSFVNLRSGTQEQAIQAGSRPWGIDVTPFNGTSQFVVVANQGDRNVVRINAVSRAIEKTIPFTAPFEPHAVATVPTNTTAGVAAKSQVLDSYVISSVQNTGATGCEIAKIAADGTSQTLLITGSKQLWKAAITPDGSEMYITDRGTNFVWKVKLATFTPDGQITLGGSGDDIAISPTGKTAYVSIPGGSSTETPNGVIDIVDLSGAGTVASQPQIDSQPLKKGDVTQPRAIAINSTGTEVWVAMQNRLGFFAGLKDPGKPDQWLSIVPYTSDPGQAPPISDIAMGGGIQN